MENMGLPPKFRSEDNQIRTPTLQFPESPSHQFRNPQIPNPQSQNTQTTGGSPTASINADSTPIRVGGHLNLQRKGYLMKDQQLDPFNPALKASESPFATSPPTNEGKQSGSLKRKLNDIDESYVEPDLSNLTQSVSGSLFGAKDSKLSERLNRVDNICKIYKDRHVDMLSDFINPKVKKMEHRTSLKKLLDVNKSLQIDQKDCIEAMGFGSFTKIDLDQLDKIILKWLIEAYDLEQGVLNIHSDGHYINDEDVKDVFGVPAIGKRIRLDASCTEGLTKYGKFFKLVRG